MQVNGDSIPSFITFSDQERTFTIYTDSSDSVGIYYFQITAILNDTLSTYDES